MSKGRLEAFSDGVFAILLTVLVLELKVPSGVDWDALAGLWPVFSSYVLSFLYLGIYWNNHHHLLQASERVTGAVLWANLLLLFWLSLLPFATGWMGEHHFERAPVVLYGAILILAAASYFVLVRTLLRCHSPDSALARAIGTDRKGRLSLLLYAVGLGATAFSQWLGVGLYTVVALVWLVPDRRIVRELRP